MRHVGRVEKQGRRIVDILYVDAHRGRIIPNRVPRILRLNKEQGLQNFEFFWKNIQFFMVHFATFWVTFEEIILLYKVK